MLERIEKLEGSWFGRLEELVEEIEEIGLEVVEANAEYIVCMDPEEDEDTECRINLAGTETTITIKSIEEC